MQALNLNGEEEIEGDHKNNNNHNPVDMITLQVSNSTASRKGNASTFSPVPIYEDATFIVTVCVLGLTMLMVFIAWYYSPSHQQAAEGRPAEGKNNELPTDETNSRLARRPLFHVPPHTFHTIPTIATTTNNRIFINSSEHENSEHEVNGTSGAGINNNYNYDDNDDDDDDDDYLDRIYQDADDIDHALDDDDDDDDDDDGGDAYRLLGRQVDYVDTCEVIPEEEDEDHDEEEEVEEEE